MPAETHHGNPMTINEGGHPMDPHAQEPSPEEEDPALQVVIDLNESPETESAPVSKM